MAVVKAITIAKEEYKMLLKIERKYRLIIQTITNNFMSTNEKIRRIDDITEDSYQFQKGE